MSLFGNLGATSTNAQAQAAKPGGLFNFSQPKQEPPKSTFGFGATQQSQPQQSGGLFGTSQTQPQQPGGLFGQSSQQQQQQQQQPGGLFGQSSQQQQPGSLFSQPQQQSGSFFAPPTQQQQPAPSFGGFGQSQQQQQQQQQNQRPLDQTLRFGTSQSPGQSQNATQSMWEEGRGLGVYRSIPAQMQIVKNKWDAAQLDSSLRHYLYQNVGDEAEALRYRPGPDDDENEWDKAVAKRPGPTWVPVLVRGFFELGKKAQIQMETMHRCNMMLQEINTSLDMQIDIHRQKVATRLAECRRRQLAASRRTIALAAKVQTLRNRGYVMDNAEEELKVKLEKLEKEVFDPSIEAREQEIWARMLGIRERAKRLQAEMEKLAPAPNSDRPVLDETTIKAAKQTLEAYDTQLRHLHEELQLVQQEYNDWDKIAKKQNEGPRQRM